MGNYIVLNWTITQKKKPGNETWTTHVDRPGIINSETLKGADDDTWTRLVLSNRSRQLYIVQIEAVKIDSRLNQIPCPSPPQPSLPFSYSLLFPPISRKSRFAFTSEQLQKIRRKIHIYTYINIHIYTHTYTYRKDLYIFLDGMSGKSHLGRGPC